MLELIAAGAVGAVASAAGTVILMRRNLAKDRADLIREQNELDHAGDMQDLRHADLAQWAGWLATETDRVNRWDAYIASLPAGFVGGPGPEEPTVELIPAKPVRARFSYDPTAADRVHTVALPEPGEVLREQAGVLFAETRALTDYAAEVADSALFGAEHFESEALNAELQAILADGAWGLLHGGELTEALTAARVGMPTGQYPMLDRPTNPWDQPKPADPAPKPKLIGQPRVPAEVLHAMWDAAQRADRPGTGTDMPVPTPPPTNPAVAVAR